MLSTIIIATAFLTIFGCSLLLEDAPAPQSPADSVAPLTNAPFWRGSGVVVGKVQRGGECKVSVVTAGHVAQGADNLQLGTTRAFTITIHPKHDIAVVVFFVPGSCEEAVKYAPAVPQYYPAPQPLDRLIHVGWPGSEYQIGYATYVSTFGLPGRVYGVITSVAGPGSSGGGVFLAGRLVGILTNGETVQPFRNYYVPIYYASEIVPDLD